MSAGYQAKNPRGSRKNNAGDAEAIPLLSARVLRLAKDDAASGRPLSTVSEYYRLSVESFHNGITGPPLRFVNLKDGVPDTLTGRATTFRKWAGDELNKFICLSVAGNHAAAKQFTAVVRTAAERYLVDDLFTTTSAIDRYRSAEYVRAFFHQLEREKCFAGVMSDTGFANFCLQFPSHKHEARLIEFAKLTSGLCS